MCQGLAGERDADADGALARARALFSAQNLRCRRGESGAAAGLAEAGRRLVLLTRANYKKQNLEKFDFSGLDEAARLAKVFSFFSLMCSSQSFLLFATGARSSFSC